MTGLNEVRYLAIRRNIWGKKKQASKEDLQNNKNISKGIGSMFSAHGSINTSWENLSIDTICTCICLVHKRWLWTILSLKYDSPCN